MMQSESQTKRSDELLKLLRLLALAFFAASASLIATPAPGAVAGTEGVSPLFIVKDGKAGVVIVRSPQAGPIEQHAAEDLAKYINLMTGAPVPIVTAADAKTLLSSQRPAIWVGRAALEANPRMAERLQATVKQKPVLRADGIALLREGNKVFLAGSNDESHYFAVAELLRAWGVRWFMPGAFGECVPEQTELAVGDLDIFYAPPFEARTFGISWLGSGRRPGRFRVEEPVHRAPTYSRRGPLLVEICEGLGQQPLRGPADRPQHD